MISHRSTSLLRSSSSSRASSFIRRFSLTSRRHYSTANSDTNATPIETSEDYKKALQQCQTRNHRALNMIHKHVQCQLSTFVVADTSAPNIKSTNVPYALFSKSKKNLYFDISQQEPADSNTTKASTAAIPSKHKPSSKKGNNNTSKNSSTSTTADKNEETNATTNGNQAEIHHQQTTNTELEHYELVFCVKHDSQHVENLAHVDSVFSALNGSSHNRSQMVQLDDHGVIMTDDSKPDFYSTMVSMTFGLADPKLTQLFRNIELLPPRSVLCGDVQVVPDGSKAFSSLWKEYFRPHPNVAYELRMDQVKMYRLSNIRSVHFMDLSMKMLPVESLSDFVSLKADGLPGSRHMIHKLNTQKELLQKITSRVYNLKLGSCFVFDIDQCGIRLLGRQMVKNENQQLVESEQWNEYYLDFGYIVDSEAKLTNFFMQVQSVI